ncbi:hypothetical protein [Alkalihalobacterium alkalinitrilicum]|nr:hypothetical protein [Alkalihalobacterium alkalinitrilicum]
MSILKNNLECYQSINDRTWLIVAIMLIPQVMAMWKFHFINQGC